MNNFIYDKVLIIGVGLIGSSIARAIKLNKLSLEIYGVDLNPKILKKCKDLEILNECKEKIEDYKIQFDLIIICSPLSTYKNIFTSLNNFITNKTLLTDVGSTKVSVIKDFREKCHNKKINFIPGHPIAGLEKSGPEYGFAELFENRFCILTPINQKDECIGKIENFWKKIGMKTQIMEAKYHDKILAMTSHIPQLIAYSIVSTATELESNLQEEVIKYSAAGFRDFTRLAGSDPIMWRDIYSKNKEAVLEMLARFTHDLNDLRKAIDNNDLSSLEKVFRSTREIRKTIEKIGQAGSFDPTESKK